MLCQLTLHSNTFFPREVTTGNDPLQELKVNFALRRGGQVKDTLEAETAREFFECNCLNLFFGTGIKFHVSAVLVYAGVSDLVMVDPVVGLRRMLSMRVDRLPVDGGFQWRHHFIVECEIKILAC